MTDSPRQQLTSQSQSLATITVDEFFSQINWSGIQSVPSHTVEVEMETTYETVGQFFATFPWQGPKNSLSSALTTDLGEDDLEQLIDGEDVMTLDDLSALF